MRTLQRKQLVSWFIVLVSALFFISKNQVEIFADTGSIKNVRDFGAKGDGKTDDTKAIQAAFDAAGRSYIQANATGRHGHSAFAGPTVYFPAGDYLISDAVTIPGIGNIKGEPYAILRQASSEKDILVTRSAFRMIIEGFTFIGGRTQLNLYNPNMNTGKITVSQCYFFSATGVALNADIESTTLVVQDCEFIIPMQGMTLKRSDMVMVRDCWFGNAPEMKDKAFIENRAQQVTFENIAGVPAVNGFNQRWIDNYGTNLTIRKFRFGGEDGGFVPVVNYTKPRPLSIGTSIVIEDSWCCNVGNIKNCIIYLEEIPNVISLRNNYTTSSNLVKLSDKINIDTYFQDLNIEASQLSFMAEGNIGGSLERRLPDGLLKPKAAPGSGLPSVSAELVNEMVSKAVKEWLKNPLPDLTKGESNGHLQQTDPAKYIDINPDNSRWDASDFMDATRIRNDEYLIFATAGTDSLWVWKRKGENWPHFTIKDIMVDLDKTPFLTWKIKTTGEAPKGAAFKVLVRDKGIESLIDTTYYQENVYKAHNLRQIFGLSGRHRIDIRIYPPSYGFKDPTKNVDTSDPDAFIYAPQGSYGVFDFIRFESDDKNQEGL